VEEILSVQGAKDQLTQLSFELNEMEVLLCQFRGSIPRSLRVVNASVTKATVKDLLKRLRRAHRMRDRAQTHIASALSGGSSPIVSTPIEKAQKLIQSESN